MHKKSLTWGFPIPTIGFVRCSKRSPGAAGRRDAMTPIGAGAAIRYRVLPNGNVGRRARHVKGHIMYNATEQFAALNQAGVSNAVKLVSLYIENTEKLVQLNISAAKRAIAQAVQSAQAVAS